MWEVCLGERCKCRDVCLVLDHDCDDLAHWYVFCACCHEKLCYKAIILAFPIHCGLVGDNGCNGHAWLENVALFHMPLGDVSGGHSLRRRYTHSVGSNLRH